jgi:hypothetical protein
MKYLIKSIASLIMVFILVFNIKGQTIVPEGNVNGIWTITGSPYQIAGNITVPAGETLEIQAGVKVEFQGYYKLLVYGKLQALGEKNNMIHFTVNDTTGFWNDTVNDGAWNGIELRDNNSDLSVIDYCKMEFVKSSVFYSSSYMKIVFKNNIIYNNKEGLDLHYGYAIIFSEESNIYILNNKVFNNYYSFYFGNINNLVFSNNLVYNNNGGINASADVFGILSNSTICNNKHTGLNLTLSNLYIYNCIIYGNSGWFNNDGKQCYFDWGTYNFYNCDIQNISYCENPGTPGDITVNYSIEEPPKFINPTAGAGPRYNAFDADWRLSPTSPCIDAGFPDTTGLGIPTKDLAGETRVYNGVIDMGAYEYNGYTGTNKSDNKQISIYSVPSNRTVNILFNNIISKNVNIYVYNISGQIVYSNTLANSDRYNIETVNLSKYNCSVYIVKIIYDNKEFTQKILMK